MNEFSSFFHALYSHFLLRDFFGKIVPRLTVLFLTMSLFCSFNEIRNELRTAYFFEQLLVVGMGWITGLAVQKFGMIIKIFDFSTLRINGHPNEQYRDYIELLHKFTLIATQEEKSQFERYVVIKEASGTGASALILCILLIGIIPLLRFIFEKQYVLDLQVIYYGKIPLAILLSLMFCLLRSRYIHSKIHQDQWMMNALSEYNAKQTRPAEAS